ncbi:MAG: TauD/TfdA family dioxygenase [Acidimicrobiia bacterium]|nr:TauD/TfdA family dioxygenase [Acidimicrobiia bacterium]
MTTTQPAAIDDLRPLETHCEWRAADIVDSYVWHLDRDEIAELAEALSVAQLRCDDVLDVTVDDFPLPTLGARLVDTADQLINGAGVRLIRGWPTEGHTREQNEIVYWGVGMHLGRPWPQNARGHLLGDVTDQKKAANDPTSRGNEVGGIAFPFHSDGSDLVGLFCLDPGAEGGKSIVANALAIHNELVRNEPEVAAELYGDLPYDYRGEERAGGRPWYTMPAFQRHDERLFVRYIRPYINSVKRHESAPRLAPSTIAAMDRLDAMCADPTFHVKMQLEPGDMQFINNYHVLHGRDSYADDADHGRVRHLKRLWLETRVLADDQKPESFRLDRTASHWNKRKAKDDFAAQRG